jgi:hypothetical protein
MSDLNLKTAVGNWVVSTVKLPFALTDEEQYETMVYPGKDGAIIRYKDVYLQRYRREEDAVKGHKQVCKLVESWSLNGGPNE